MRLPDTNPEGGIPWWNTKYQTRFQVTVMGGVGGAAQGDVAAIPKGPGNATRRDWRLLYWNGATWQELPRVATSDRTWFRLTRTIAPGGSDGNYWLYGNNPEELSAPPTAGVLRFFDDFNGGLNQWQATPASANATLRDGLLRLSAPAPNGAPNNYLVSAMRFGPGTMVEVKARSVSYTGDSGGLYGRNVDFGFASQPLNGDARWRLENHAVWQYLVDPGVGYGAAPRSTIPGGTEWHIFQVGRYPATDGRAFFSMDDGQMAWVQNAPLTPMGDIGIMLRTYDNIPPPAGAPVLGVHAEVDWVAVFDIPSRRPPVVQVGPPEGEGGSILLTLSVPGTAANGLPAAQLSLWHADAAPSDPPFQHYHLNLDPGNSLSLDGLAPGNYTVEVGLRQGRCTRFTLPLERQTRISMNGVEAPRGDLNNDGLTTIRDQALLAAALPATKHTQNYNALADLTRDGEVNPDDLARFAHDWRRGIPCTSSAP